MASDGSDIRFFDNHTINMAELGLTTSDQIDKSLNEFFRGCSKYYSKPREFWGQWKINVATSRGLATGVAYIFFMKSTAYHVILDKDPFGNDRKYEIPNPKYKEPEREEEIAFQDIDWNSHKIAWGDAVVENSEPKTISVPCKDTAVSFPAIKLTLDQQEKMKISSICPLIRACVAYNPESYLNKYTLFTKNVPTWITEIEIKALFSPYITNSSDLEKGFPKVTFAKQMSRKRGGNNDFFNKKTSGDFDVGDWKIQGAKKEEKLRRAFIKFNSYGNDSMFALVMTRKAVIRGTGPNSGKQIELLFSYARDKYYE